MWPDLLLCPTVVRSTRKYGRWGDGTHRRLHGRSRGRTEGLMYTPVITLEIHRQRGRCHHLPKKYTPVLEVHLVDAHSYQIHQGSGGNDNTVVPCVHLYCSKHGNCTMHYALLYLRSYNIGE